MKRVQTVKGFLCFLCFLAGCSAQSAVAPDPEQAMPSPSTVVQPTPPAVPRSATLSDATTYIGIHPDGTGGVSFVPVSYVSSGEQQLTGTHHVYSQFSEEFLGVLPEAQTLPQTGFTDRSHPDSRFAAVASSGAWDLFPVQAVYTAYELDGQPDRTEWIDYFQAQLSAEGIDSPVVLVETWQFPWDGAETAVVTASNGQLTGDRDILYSDSPAGLPALPAKEETAVYLLSAIFRAGAEPVLLEKRICPIENTPITVNDLGVSYRPPEEGSYQQYLSAIQWDKDGNLSPYPVFCDMNGDGTLCDYQYRPDCLVCDLDGNGTAELVVYKQGRSSLMCVCSVYQLIQRELCCTYAVVLN